MACSYSWTDLLDHVSMAIWATAALTFVRAFSCLNWSLIPKENICERSLQWSYLGEEHP